MREGTVLRGGKVWLVLIAGLLAFAAVAQASYYYLPRHHHACAPHFKREMVKVPEVRHGLPVWKHHRVVWVEQARCVYVAPKLTVSPPTSPPLGGTPAPVSTPAPTPTPTPAPSVSYSTHVDPSFMQAASNPLAVTYAYSADATLTNANGTTSLAASGQLPAGVLDFYSAQVPGGPESLYCSMNVGGATAGSTCPISYREAGTYNVTTQYVPSSASAVTETDSETINPYTTTTTESASGPSSCRADSNTNYTGTTCAYQLAASVVDQNGTALNPSYGPVAFRIMATDAGGTATATFTPTGSAMSCTLAVDSRTYPSLRSYMDGWYIGSSDCTGSGVGGSSATFTTTATFGGSGGWTQSASGPQSL